MTTAMDVIDRALGDRRGAASELARLLDVSKNTVSRWRRDGPVPPNRWLDIEDALGLNRFTIAEQTGMIAHLPDLKSMSADEAQQTWRALFPPDDAAPRSLTGMQNVLLRGLDHIEDQLASTGWVDPDPFLVEESDEATPEQSRLLQSREIQRQKIAEASASNLVLERQVLRLDQKLSSLREDLDRRLEELSAEGLRQEQKRQILLHYLRAFAEQLGVDPTTLPHVD